MFKFKQGKKLIVCMLCFMLTLLAVFSGEIVLNNVKLANKTQNQPQATDYNTVTAYDFAGGRIEDIDDSRYKDYTYFSISNYTELLEFSISVAYGCNFDTKTVFLEDHVFSNGANWQPIGASMDGTKYKGYNNFLGTFDGCNFSVNNLKCEIESASVLGKVYIGFFAIVSKGAEIKNLHIKNFTIENYNSNFVGFYMSGLIPALTGGGVSVYNCLLENIVLNGDTNAADDYFGGFVCYINGNLTTTLQNCMIKGLIINGVEAGDESYFATVGPATATLGNNAETTMKYNKVLLFNVSNYSKYNAEIGRFTVGNEELWIKNSSETTGKEVVKTSLKNEDAWYIPPVNDFNGGWPYLKAFIEFNYWTFTPGANGKINDSTDSVVIEIPNTIDISSLVSINHHLFYGTEILAEGNTGYMFKNWTYDEQNKTYTANFELLDFNITFNSITVTHDGQTYSFSPKFTLQEGVGKIALNEKIKIWYFGAAYPEFRFDVLTAKEGWSKWQAQYNIMSDTHKNIWFMYVIDEIIINNDKKLTEIKHDETKEFSVQEIGEKLGISIEEFIEKGITVDITFKYKEYGVGVR